MRILEGLVRSPVGSDWGLSVKLKKGEDRHGRRRASFLCCLLNGTIGSGQPWENLSRNGLLKIIKWTWLGLSIPKVGRVANKAVYSPSIDRLLPEEDCAFSKLYVSSLSHSRRVEKMRPVAQHAVCDQASIYTNQTFITLEGSGPVSFSENIPDHWSKE